MKRIEYGFRITHIDNIPYIDSTGFVLANSQLASPCYTSIGDSSVIEKRKTNTQGIDLTQYIPFYFGPRSVMLYVIQHGYNGVQQQNAEDIVYTVIKIENLIKDRIECLFTDGHALSALTTFYTHEHLTSLNSIVSYNDVYAKYWLDDDDLDLKRRKEAELLVKEHLPSQYISGYVVYNAKAKATLASTGINESRIVINPHYYFQL